MIGSQEIFGLSKQTCLVLGIEPVRESLQTKSKRVYGRPIQKSQALPANHHFPKGRFMGLVQNKTSSRPTADDVTTRPSLSPAITLLVL